MSLSNKVINSSLIMISAKLIERGIGFISLLILARILTPEDFGIVAISSLVIYFFEALTMLGGEQYIIQKTKVTDADLDTIWTFELILKSMFWLALVIATPFIANYYENPNLELVLYASSSILILGALKNPGFSLHMKELRYIPIFKIDLTKKLISFSFVVPIAIYYETYWALIIGSVVSMVVFTLGTYALHSYRPRLSLSQLQNQWKFSQWILYKGCIGYIRAQMDTAIVSTIFPVGKLGKYYLVRDISVMPSIDIIMPAISPLLSAYSKAKADKFEIARKFDISFVILNLAIIPLCVFIYFFPEPIIDFLLGSKWDSTYELLQIFTLLLYSIAILQILNQFCIAIGKVKQLFLFDLTSTIIVGFSLYTLTVGNLSEFAGLRGALGIGMVLILFAYLAVQSEVSFLKNLTCLIPIYIVAFLTGYITTFLLPLNEILGIPMVILVTLEFFGIYLCLMALAYLSVLKYFQSFNQVKLILCGYLGIMNRVR